MIIHRVLALLDDKSLKMADLCRHLGINTSTMTNWKNRETDPPARFIAPICEFCGCSYEYLLTGTESLPHDLSKEDSEWISLIHQLPPEAQIEFRGELKGYLKRYQEESVAADASLTQAK